jgi:hypothetical protein
LCNFLHSPVTSSLLGPNILLRTLFSNILHLYELFVLSRDEERKVSASILEQHTDASSRIKNKTEKMYEFFPLWMKNV